MSIDVLHLDIETFSECDLKKAGLYRYAEHPSTELLCFCYALNDEPVETWKPGMVLPDRLVNYIEAGGTVAAHNAQFERIVLNSTAGENVDFPKLRAAQMICTAAKCAAAGLPRHLGDAARALGTHPKDDAGKIVMLQLSRPRKGKEPRWTPDNAPEKFDTLYAYCADDVRAERGIDKNVPDLSPREQRVWELDQLINDRGIAVDLEAVENVRALVYEYKLRLAFECELATGLSITQTGELANWVRGNGFPYLTDLQAETVKATVLGAGPESTKRVLRMFSTYNAKAISKFDAIARAVCADGRLHGMFLYHGAGTGRWASMIVQLQNLFRPVIDHADIEIAIAAFKTRDLDWLHDIFPENDPLKVMASCVRAMLVPAPGKVLQSLDFAGVESRVNAWLFGEEWKLQAFRDFDAGIGPDLYCVTYGRAFRVDPRSIGKKDPRRQLGKVQDLAFGYEGGVVALIEWADQYGIDLEEMASQVRQILPGDVVESAEWMWQKFGAGTGLPHHVYIACDGVKQLWRQGHPKIKAGWKSLKEAAALAVENPGTAYVVPGGKIAFKVTDEWLQMKLPSGRRVKYFKPTFEGDTVSYMGVDTKTRRWMRTKTYGGKLCENAVQAISRDLLVNSMFELEAAGYASVGSVHDEVISEINTSFCDLDKANEIMCRLPGWAAGLPIAAEGWRATRYQK